MKRIKILCDPMLSSLYIVFLLIMTSISAISVSISTLFKDKKDIIIGLAISIGLYLILLITAMSVSSKWSGKVIMDSEGIRLNTLFKKGNKIPYSEYFYFQIGYYMHLVQPRIFVVISKKGLTPKQIVHINSVGISEDTVKISLNKRRANMLLEVLPEWQKNKLQRALNGELEDIGIDLSKADEPEKIIKRRKNKKMGKMYKHKKK